jgi:NTE family protein
MKADAVFEGGGVRGAAYCSAVDVFERAGFAWQRVAGTSAGAIVAAFIACGIDAAGILELLTRTDFRAFLDFEWRPWRRWRLAGEFRGDAFERWMRAAIGDRRMGETLIPLHVITSDLRNAVALEISSRSHPLLEVARAVRMSMSIPHFFLRVDWNDRGLFRQCIDGGVTRNYPIDIFDVAGEPRWPTIGFLLDEPTGAVSTVGGHVSQARAEVEFMRSVPARDLDEHNAYRSVRIADGGISWLNFRLTEAERQTLLSNGTRGAKEFLQRWQDGGGFDGYVRRYRAP